MFNSILKSRRRVVLKNIRESQKYFLYIFISLYVNISYPQSLIYKVENVVSNRIIPFDLTEIKLLDSPFRKAMELDETYLLELNPDRLLSWFRKEAGLKPKGEVYGGWESEQLAGHTLGHYLSACSMMYASTGNQKLLDRVNYIIDELDSCQTANGNGYVAAIPGGKKLFKEISERNIISKKTYSFRLNGIWSPWYTIHKLFAGLLDAQKYCHNEKALMITKKLGDWAFSTTKNLTRKEFQQMLICEYGGMNESLAELYSRTGKKKYLELAERFFDDTVLVPLENQKDILNGLHSNTQIPKIIGLMRLYELTGNQKFKSTSEFFWKTVVNHHSYVTGGNSEDEHFGKPDDLSARLDSNTSETCNTYNMLKLTRRLFDHNSSVTYADYYERALYNHILASQNPQTGMFCYYVPLEPGSYKVYSTPLNSFWCCVGTGMENHSKYGRNIYFHNNDSLLVNLFIPSVLQWKEKKLELTQQTNFPDDGKTKLILNCESPVSLTLLIRYPGWSKKGINILVNGVEQKINNKPGSFIKIIRQWKSGDTVEVEFTMSLHIETMKDNHDRAAIMYGPLVLAGKLGTEDDTAAENIDYVPAFVPAERKISEWIKPVTGEVNVFRTLNAGHPREITLYPFYRMHNLRYSVYWDILSPAKWKKRTAEITKEKDYQKKLNESAIDFVHPGKVQQEEKHNYKGEQTGNGEESGNKWRDAISGGWFSYDLKIDDDKPVSLVCKYWGGVDKERNFDILADGEKIALQKLYNDKPGRFFYVTYPINEKLTKGKEKITVKFSAPQRGVAGGVFGVWSVK